MTPERIIVIDRHPGRLHRTKDMLGKYFNRNEILGLEYEGTLSAIPQQVGDRFSELFQRDIAPLLVTNIDGLLSGTIERALLATQYQMHSVLATCWPEDKVLLQTYAHADRFSMAKGLGAQTYVHLPGWDTPNSNIQRLLKHMKSFPNENPFKIEKSFQWDGPSA